MEERLSQILEKQLNNFFDVNKVDKLALKQFCIYANNETVALLHKVNNKYCLNYPLILNTTFSNGWTVFLYKLSNMLYKNNYIETASKIYYLNKIMNSKELFYEVEMPQNFFLDHPLGSVMGRAKYGEFFTFSQGCTVGENKGVYPRIGNFVTMMSNSKIVGKSIIGNNCIIAANTYVKDAIVPDNTIVFNNGKELVFKENKFDNAKNWIL